MSVRLSRRFQLSTLAVGLLAAVPALAQEHRPGGEANLILPDLDSAQFLGVGGATLLYLGLAVSALGLLFGLAIYRGLKTMPVHRSMLDVSELIYETCQTYLHQQGRFLLILWLFIGSNVLWIVWGVSEGAWALILLQVGLFVLNIRGARKNETA